MMLFKLTTVSISLTRPGIFAFVAATYYNAHNHYGVLG